MPARAATACATALRLWAESSLRPLVLLLDEIDVMRGDALVTVLRQLRSRYDERPASFPQSVVPCGVRNVRDYRIAEETGGSAFNIKAESLRLADFTEEEMRALLTQHTEETGQEFTPGAMTAAWEQTQGQPWLVNALCREACFRSKVGRDRERAITEEAVFDARENLIRRRETHLDQLGSTLRDDPVRRVIEPILAGAEKVEWTERDLEQVRDLGLIAQDPPPRIANPIYAEVIPRELTQLVQEELEQDPKAYVAKDGSLKVARLLKDFQDFFRVNSEQWSERFEYKEAGPHLLLHAYLRNVVNSGGRVERERSAGRRRTDLMIAWRRKPEMAEGRSEDRIVLERKVLRWNREETIRAGVEQTAGYMDVLEAREGHLVIFDVRTTMKWRQKIFDLEETAADGTPVKVWGMSAGSPR